MSKLSLATHLFQSLYVSGAPVPSLATMYSLRRSSGSALPALFHRRFSDEPAPRDSVKAAATPLTSPSSVSPAVVAPHISSVPPPLAVTEAALLPVLHAWIYGQVLPHERVSPPGRSGRSVLKRGLIGEKIASWYPDTSAIDADPLFYDTVKQTNSDRLKRMKRRGKGPPKKGAGKRATRKKK